MTNLIKSEMKKIFHKKSFYIVTIIFILYAILTNVIYKNIDDMGVEEPVSIQELEEKNNLLDLKNEADLNTYISNLTEIETKKLEETYENASSKYLIKKYIYDLVYSANQKEYIEENLTEANLIRTTINDYITKIANNDWKYFANLHLQNLKELETKDDKTKTLIKLTEYRLEKNIPYDSNNYLNNALEDIELNLSEYYNLEKKDKTKEEQERYTYLKQEMLTNKYILENNKDIKNNETLQGVLSNFASEFGLFILIYVVMLCGSIVSEEYNKGTIKYLLTKPHKRSAILTSKLLTVLILIPLIIIGMIVLEILIGGLILGFSSLNVPVLIYNSASGILETYNIFKYLILSLISTLPIYLVLGIICFMLSTVTASTSAAITITFLFYLISNVISNLALVYNLKMFNYFVALHWDFSYLLTKSTNPYNFTPGFSLTVIAIYLLIILSITYVYFNKKDVKNI